jgi:hypothetical protein
MPHMALSTNNPGLYARLLGESWAGLADAVRRMHCNGSTVRGQGRLRVSRCNNLLARCLATLLRLPSASEAVLVTLTIAPVNDWEDWTRTFDGRPLVTRQWLGPQGLLVEQNGMMELRFRLAVHDGGLDFQRAGAALRLGRLRVPVPSFLAPLVRAREMPAGHPGRTAISVQISLPLVGLLIAYEGQMTCGEEEV